MDVRYQYGQDVLMNIVENAKANVLSWFTGKANINAITALQMLEDSEKAGEWIPGASRSVKAALTKSNVAHKLYKKHGNELDGINSHYEDPREIRGWSVAFLLQFGRNAHIPAINFKAVSEAARDNLKPVVAQAEKLWNDLAPLYDLMDKLDATRPKPVVTYLNASPTVTKLIESLGLVGTVASTIRLCPMRYEEVEVEVNGKKVWKFVGILEWPAGTVFGTSRYAELDHMWPTGQCQACGHAIKNAFNWVPLIVDNAEGVPHALWVGTDCSKTLFGVSVKGPMEIQGQIIKEAR
jgi:hypothetical protein